MDEIDVWYMIFWCVNFCNWFFNNFDIFYSTTHYFEKITNICKYKYFKLLMIQRQFCNFGKDLEVFKFVLCED